MKFVFNLQLYRSPIGISRHSEKSDTYPLSGFTLIELIIVIAIVGILASFAIPAYREEIDRARFISSVSLLEIVRLDMEDYRNQQKSYPTSIEFSTFTDQEGRSILHAVAQEDIHRVIFTWDGYAGDEDGYTIIAKAINNNHTALTLTPIGIRY